MPQNRCPDVFRQALILSAALLTVACASTGGQPQALPTLTAEQGRIVVYRAPGPLALSAIRPDVWLGDRNLGPAFACAYRVVDTPPGTYRAGIGDTVQRTVEFEIAAGETVYLRTFVSTGSDLREGGIERAEPAKASALVPRLNAVALHHADR